MDMPKGSPIIQAAFHSIGELLYKVVHFYDYWIQDSTKIIYSLPVRGDWLVANGGETPETSHSYDIINQRVTTQRNEHDKNYCSARF